MHSGHCTVGIGDLDNLGVLLATCFANAGMPQQSSTPGPSPPEPSPKSTHRATVVTTLLGIILRTANIRLINEVTIVTTNQNSFDYNVLQKYVTAFLDTGQQLQDERD